MPGSQWRLRGGLLLLVLATGAVAFDSGGGPAAPPKKPPLPKTARPAVAGTAGTSAPLKPVAEPEGDPAAALRSSSKTSTLAMTRLVVRALTVAQPYLRNPLRLPPRIGAAATLFVLSFWFLFGAVTSLLRLLLKPADFAVNLCLGSALHYAALVALRGVGRQLQLMASAERLPFTMATATSFLAAAYVGLRGERLGSYLFGPPKSLAASALPDSDEATGGGPVISVLG